MRVATLRDHSSPAAASIAPVVDSPAPARLTSVVVRGVPLSVPCPSWCTVDHSSVDLLFLEDLSHQGGTVSLPVPAFGGQEEQVLIARVMQFPFSPTAEGRGPRVALEAADDSDPARLDAAGVESVADSLEQHAAVLRDLAGAL